ncbi:hypothetical protein [Flavobacterium laiguense]|uniref:Uncharacterized protein n=1 Tax=Flavobacterium laiguense TaxID=2169409 RepID=A0A2U1JWD4_9FLAO|nr:hypothetical protein [Flavobacterium laiguense]PWA09517.1 hypothetical protein DB891_07490 [Flavobacterium laiguense]
MRELDLLMEKLNSDQYAGVSVFDLDTNAFLFRNKTHAEIMQEHQSAENFFESLFAKGHKTLELTQKRKNGSSYKVLGASFKVNFSPDTQTVQPQSLSQMQIPQVQQPIFAEPMQNSFGLGTLDIVNLMVSKGDATRLYTECEILKSENKEQKKLIEELKEERLATKYNSEKSSANQGMIMGALQHLPALAGIFNGGATAGLAGAVEQFTTPAKKAFATTLQQLDDTVVSVLYNINTGLNTNNEFSVELAELLKKHNLWQS